MANALLEIAIYAISITVIKMLVPDNTFKKQLNFIISCVFLLGIVFFISSGNYDLSGFADIFNQKNKEANYVDFSEEF
ncbi:MAG: hypothetical protein LBR74_06265, partial [Eubacterium sp.]|nr:hypothetical protein [Eubacterium sp.]